MRLQLLGLRAVARELQQLNVILSGCATWGSIYRIQSTLVRNIICSTVICANILRVPYYMKLRLQVTKNALI